MRYLLGTLLFTTTLFAAESRFSEAEAKFNREYDAAKAVFDRAVKVAQDKLVVAYNEEMKRLTVKGDLDGAVALRDKIKNLEQASKKEPEQIFIGDYSTQWGSWSIRFEKNTYSLYQNNLKISNSCEISDNKLIFDCHNNHNSMIIDFVKQQVTVIDPEKIAPILFPLKKK